MANAVLDNDTGELLEYLHLISWPQFREAWGKSYGNELGKLAQGIPRRVDGTNTIVFIHKQTILNNRFKYCTNGKIVCDYKEKKRSQTGHYW